MWRPKPIKLTESDTARFWSKVDCAGPDDCWEWTEGCNRDYGIFHDCNGSTYLAHRVAFVVTNGDTKLQVCHTCNNPPCCNPNHLYAGTQKDNMDQCVAEGRSNRGESSSSAKLTEFDVYAIRWLRAGGWLQREIAEEYGICQSQVSRICLGKNWKHI